MTTTPTITSRPFPLGQIVSTPGGIELNPEDRFQALRRHASCDWGNCCPDDWAQNDFAVDNGSRLLSVYQDRYGVKFWIITEADRSVTTILLPSEY